jgi:hypothetical protein
MTRNIDHGVVQLPAPGGLMSAGDMLGALREAVADPAQVRTRAVDLHANAHDASHFLLIPQAVVVTLTRWVDCCEPAQLKGFR